MSPPPPPSILYQDATQSITILDIPLSLKEAQSFPTSTSRRLLSAKPLEHPYPSVEPKSKKARDKLPQPSVDELLLVRYLELVLESVKEEWKGEWCLPRAFQNDDGVKKRKGERLEKDDDELGRSMSGVRLSDEVAPDFMFLHNPSPTALDISNHNNNIPASLPPQSTVLQGAITSTISVFWGNSPKEGFELILMDPPWPNRSARRKGSYSISSGTHEIQDLLLSLPISSHLQDGGMVGVWITNKAAFRSSLLSPCGIFDLWGLELIEEWIWVKTTVSGEPICQLDSAWRKPYEILLVGKRKVSGDEDQPVKKRVIFGVPDLHSRKPNLKGLFEQIGVKGQTLEIFARNCTAGWWSWGNEALKFQEETCWTEDPRL